MGKRASRPAARRHIPDPPTLEDLRDAVVAAAVVVADKLADRNTAQAVLDAAQDDLDAARADLEAAQQALNAALVQAAG